MEKAIGDAVIEIENLCKSFGTGEGRFQVLDGVSLVIQKGEFVSLMGASGSGKSTLLYLIGGLDTADSGTIRLAGRDISRLGDKEFSRIRRQEMGFVFQFYNLVQNLSVEDNILMPLLMDGKNARAYREKLDEILEITGLTDKRHAFPNQLSGGQKQRTAIARAVITEPGIILADEPTGNLDSRAGMGVMELFSRINREKHITILQVTHSDRVASYAQRTILLADGTIAGEGELGA